MRPGVSIHSRGLARAGLLGLGLLALLIIPMDAWALHSVCRADPIVVLTNGTQIRMTASVQSDASLVQRITYVLHAPVGSVVHHIVYTGGALGSKETVQFYADKAGRRFTTETTVQMTDSRNCGRAFTAESSVSGQGGQASGSYSQTACVALPITLNP